MIFKDIALVVHGYTVLCIDLFKNGLGPLNQDWHYLVWGDSKEQLLGRATKGVLLAIKHQAVCMIWGTGASWINDEGYAITRKEYDGLHDFQRDSFISEAQYTLNYVLDHFDELLEFEELADEINYFKGGLKGAKKFIASISRIEQKSINTQQEIYYGLRICNNFPQIQNIYRVSNPGHTSRCTWTASKELRPYKKPRRFSDIFTSECDTIMAAEGEEPCIFEPHSGPTKRPEIHPTDIFPQYWLIPAEKREEFLRTVQMEIQGLIS